MAVLTQPEPVLHLFVDGDIVEFGSEGEGPMELDVPSDLAWTEDALVVLDMQQKKLVSFAPDGTPERSRSLEGHWARRLFIVGADTILGTFAPMTGTYAVLRLRGGVLDTVMAYSRTAGTHRLEAPGAPSLTVLEPFSAETEWTVTSDAMLVVWSPGATELTLHDLDGRIVGAIAVAAVDRRVSPADREGWFTEEFITAEFQGRAIFRPLLEPARDVVTFPTVFPRVLGLQAHPAGGVWVQRTPAFGGEIWELFTPDGGSLGSLELPAGRTLLRVTSTGLLARTVDEALGTEHVEVFALPIWAPR